MIEAQEKSAVTIKCSGAIHFTWPFRPWRSQELCGNVSYSPIRLARAGIVPWEVLLAMGYDRENSPQYQLAAAQFHQAIHLGISRKIAASGLILLAEPEAGVYRILLTFPKAE